MNLKPTMYVDDEGQTYRPDSLPEGKKLYGMYHEKVVLGLVNDVHTLKTSGGALVYLQGSVWDVIEDVRMNGVKALERWEVCQYGNWARILVMENGQFNLNGNLEYRRIEDGDGS